jgi:hypothetical protein
MGRVSATQPRMCFMSINIHILIYTHIYLCLFIYAFLGSIPILTQQEESVHNTASHVFRIEVKDRLVINIFYFLYVLFCFVIIYWSFIPYYYCYFFVLTPFWLVVYGNKWYRFVNTLTCNLCK